MALGYFVGKDELGLLGKGGRKKNLDHDKLKADFWDNVSVLQEVGRVEGIRIASFLYPDHVPVYFKSVEDENKLITEKARTL